MLPFLDIDAFGACLPPKGRLIGLDLGTKTIGLALSDIERRIATPLRTLARAAFRKNLAELVAILAEFEVVGAVLGLPLDLDGRDTPRSQSTRAFGRNLSAEIAAPIGFWDERFSTAAVIRSLIENDVSRKRRAEVVDRMAAAYILQGALDRLSPSRKLRTSVPG
jgi:putative holliday junction resolvase